MYFDDEDFGSYDPDDGWGDEYDDAAYTEEQIAIWNAAHPIEAFIYRVNARIRHLYWANFTRCEHCKKLHKHCECLPF